MLSYKQWEEFKSVCAWIHKIYTASNAETMGLVLPSTPRPVSDAKESLRSLADKALMEFGFHNGFYGNVPYELHWLGLTNDDSDLSGKADIVADNRYMGWVAVDIEGCVKVNLDIAHWLSPRDSASFVVYEQMGMSIHNSAGVAQVSLTSDGVKVKQVTV